MLGLMCTHSLRIKRKIKTHIHCKTEALMSFLLKVNVHFIFRYMNKEDYAAKFAFSYSIRYSILKIKTKFKQFCVFVLF
jgi:hypothetical protein